MKISIKTHIEAPKLAVWELFNNTEAVQQWNHASPDWHCPQASNDLKVDGDFCYTMAAKDGSFAFDLKGIYTHIDAPNSLSYRLADGRDVEVLLEDVNGATLLTETFDPEDNNPVDMQQAGWQAILNNFKIFVERQVRRP